MLYTPQIIVADTVLILRVGEFIMNWEDIYRVNISKKNLTIYKRAKIFRVRWEYIGDIVKRVDLIRDLEKHCVERNIIITKRTD